MAGMIVVVVFVRKFATKKTESLKITLNSVNFRVAFYLLFCMFLRQAKWQSKEIMSSLLPVRQCQTVANNLQNGVQKCLDLSLKEFFFQMGFVSKQN